MIIDNENDLLAIAVSLTVKKELAKRSIRASLKNIKVSKVSISESLNLTIFLGLNEILRATN